MGRGKSWDGAENEALARAWVCASEDPITGTNQTSKSFAEALRRRFIEKGPPSPVADGRYGNRNAASCKSHFDAISADAQKFYVSLRKVRACSPTGVTEDNILSMAVAIHVGKSSVMDYNNKNYDKDSWSVFKAWKILRTRPKWSDRFARADEPEGEGAGRVISCDGGPNVPQNAVGNGSSGSDRASGSGQGNGTGQERFNVGNRNAKMIRQEEMRTNAVRSMAESAKRKSTALEERNAIAVFSRPEAANLPEIAAFFRALRETYLSQALKRARTAREEDFTSSGSRAKSFATAPSSLRSSGRLRYGLCAPPLRALHWGMFGRNEGIKQRHFVYIF